MYLTETDLRDLAERMDKAEQTLIAASDRAQTLQETMRLRAKASGVQVARSYLDDAIRVAS